MRQIILRRGINIHMLSRQALFFPPTNTFFFPVFMPFFIISGVNKIFQLGLLKLSHPKDKVARSNLIAERFTNLGDTKRQFPRRRIDNILKLGEYRLCRFGAQIGNVISVINRPDSGLKHQVKRSWLSQIGRTAVRTFAVLNMVGSESALAFAAVCHRVGKCIFMSRIMQYFSISQYGGVQALNIIPLVYHRTPPRRFDIVL